ncbi:DUF2913 family protein [Shewanella marina]|uniref:DUF2913 family protein n=1 Tax=Shewanella marina TaxID=487319 RepID=UPI0004709605|nr:DUF2913 family protein [Shewanella marina]
MTELTYNQSILNVATEGLAALSAAQTKNTALQTPTAESHFLCSWMAQSLKEKRFNKSVADDLTFWVRQGRSLGVNANLKQQLTRVQSQYQQLDNGTGLAAKLQQMLTELQAQQWLVFTDTELTGKLKLDGDGLSSLVISCDEYQAAIDGDELVKPLYLYIRANEVELANIAFKHGLMLGQGNKKASLIKHHKRYIIKPYNQLLKLALLAE